METQEPLICKEVSPSPKDNPVMASNLFGSNSGGKACNDYGGDDDNDDNVGSNNLA